MSIVNETFQHIGIQPSIPEEIKKFLVNNSYLGGNEECETAWMHIAGCDECSALLYLVAVTPELAGHACWWISPKLSCDEDM